MILKVLCAFFVFWACQPLTAAAESLEVNSRNIKGLLEAKNAKVSAAKLGTEAAKEREGHLVRSFLPSVDAFAGQDTFKTGTLAQKTQPIYGAEARVNLFNGGRDHIENHIRSLESQKRGYQSQRVLAEELESARSLYWQTLYLQKKIELLNTSREVNKTSLASALRRIKSGVATDSDRFEFEMKQVDLDQEIAEAQVQLGTQIRLLKILLGLDHSATLSFSESLSHDHEYESVLKHSLSQHDFLFKENEIQAEQYQLGAKGSRRVWWPKLDAFAAYNHYNQSLDSEGPDATEDMRKETIVGLRLSVSLPAGLESSREATAQAKEAMASRALADYQKQEVEVHLQGEMNELKLLHTQVHEAEQNIARAERYYKMTQSEYSRGVKNSPDVLGASEKLFDMRHKRLQIIKNFQIAKAHVLSKVGL